MEVEPLAKLLQDVGYHSAVWWPFISTSAPVILSAVFPIYIGAHASLKCPSTARRRPKTESKISIEGMEFDDVGENLKMESLGPMDVIFLPLFAGLTLTGLYFLIKWLDDPELISKILGWYFTIFDLTALAKFLSDGLRLIFDMTFPRTYRLGGALWTEARNEDSMKADNSSEKKESPLSGPLAYLPLPTFVSKLLWQARRLPQKHVFVGLYVRTLVKLQDRFTIFPLAAFVLSVSIQCYKILVGTPWYLNNLSAFAFAYTVLQVLSPSTAVIASGILGALFIYDIYFVFYTPVMVKVATSLDIPAKLVFPRGDGFGMLGLGDIVLPGMLIGWALRFDLWLHYLRLQHKTDPSKPRANRKAKNQSENTAESKPYYDTATGNWGSRWWIRPATDQEVASLPFLKGTRFSKPYFTATMAGYVLGMTITFSVMTVFNRPQPALLYLVPTVVGSLWSAALFRGEVSVLLKYSEDSSEEENEESKKNKQHKGSKDGNNDAKQPEAQSSRGWSILGQLFSETSEEAQNASDPKSSEAQAKKAGKAKTKDEAASKKEEGAQGTAFSLNIIYPAPVRRPIHDRSKEEESPSASQESGSEWEE